MNSYSFSKIINFIIKWLVWALQFSFTVTAIWNLTFAGFMFYDSEIVDCYAINEINQHNYTNMMEQNWVNVTINSSSGYKDAFYIPTENFNKESILGCQTCWTFHSFKYCDYKETQIIEIKNSVYPHYVNEALIKVGISLVFPFCIVMLKRCIKPHLD